MAARRRLAAAGVEDPAADSRLLVMRALDLDRAGLLMDRDRRLTGAERERLDRLLARREGREPIARILGEREFWSLPFRVTPATLDPRPDSETVVEMALARAGEADRPLRVLDLGTGSGCLLLAVLSERPAAWGLGVDIDPAAAAVARENAGRLGLSGRAAFVAGDWSAALAGQFDLVLANPPYIAEGEIAGLAPEVALHEPRRALAGGADGLDAYRTLAGLIPGLLAADGWAVLEVSQGQAATVATLLGRAGLSDLAVGADLSGVDRCVAGKI
ncbi:MAG: peptide chain release factor N(5)-glutamine methyltransferase [Inquilinus sp.]|nr:peptide chain release factor N(5)-glutamine methyltransferase [Inquilinus sp.]